ncbi:AraC family transcriptional regulator [Stutzerimonas kirkiae]|uniref:AraC family transcriptional regulator n=1 Tax=Stutzerimonas kirkiae TaxID=2211392 RepID=A0A4Q9RBN5_9GAMM|nr:AraC family transcriptional regulator [Stutzerimonas kirkiae]TBU98324.1 AraC family transcriptional regulator [Stutzerimonas kirkiae]TBV01959.1 AraC family transcriptional regulator [Stutzerimonas kirkiae]
MTSAAPSAPALDRLSTVLERFRVQAALFHSGALCGTHHFEALPGRAFLHVLRRGEMEVRHRPGDTDATRLHLDAPTLLFYPRPLQHVFVNAPRDGSDFTCATLDFDGGARNPIVQSLPALVRVPLDAVDGLQPALDLLFAEADHVRCGSRLLANRLFEVVLIQLLRWIVDHPAEAGVSSGLLMGLSDPRLARSLVALHRAPHEDWPLQRMAAEAGMSRSAFAAAFKAATGSTPAAYLTDWRLTLATSLLRNGQPVKRIAVDLGFADSASFSRAFRQHMGMSPRGWLAASGLGHAS